MLGSYDEILCRILCVYAVSKLNNGTEVARNKAAPWRIDTDRSNIPGYRNTQYKNAIATFKRKAA